MVNSQYSGLEPKDDAFQWLLWLQSWSPSMIRIALDLVLLDHGWVVPHAEEAAVENCKFHQQGMETLLELLASELSFTFELFIAARHRVSELVRISPRFLHVRPECVPFHVKS